MIRLLYISNCTQAITAKQIQDILLPAQRKNASLSITGVWRWRIYAGARRPRASST